MKPALVYDGDCPFCANYAAMRRLHAKFPGIELVDARTAPDHPAVKLVRLDGLTLDDGMVLIADGKLHHGAHAMRVIDGALPARLYPLLKAGRNLILKLLGRQKLGF